MLGDDVDEDDDGAASGRRGAGTDRIREAGRTAVRTSVLAILALVVLVVYLAVAYLVWYERVDQSAFLLLTGVVLGYVLRLVQDVR
jgi:hypothetical protein